MERRESSGNSLRDILYTLFRHKWKIIIFFLVITLGVGYTTVVSPSVYESRSTLFVRVGRESIGVDPTVATGPTMSVFQSRESEINSEIEIIKSRSIADSVIDSLGPGYILRERDPSDLPLIVRIARLGSLFDRRGESLQNRREAAIQNITKNLTVKSQYNNNMIFLSYKNNSPARAQTILDEIVDAFLDKHIAVHRSSGSYEFFYEETEKLRRELYNTEQQLSELRSRIGIVSIEEQRHILLERIGGLQDRIQSTEAQIAATEALVESMKRNLDPDLDREEGLLQSLIATLDTQKSRYTALEAELDRLNEGEFRLRNLERKVEMLDVNYKRYLENLEMARISQALEEEKISNISIVQTATLPDEPVSPKRKRNLALGLFLGITVGLFGAFIIEYFDHTLKNPDDVENLLDVGTSAVPYINTGRFHRELQKRVEPQYRGQVSLNRLARDITVWVYTQENIRGSFENIRDRITKAMREHQQRQESEKPFVLAVTSNYRGEGVTSVATGIAYTVSLYNEDNVLLVDSNLHHPEIDRVSGINRPPGLYEISIGHPTLANQNDINRLLHDNTPQLSQFMSTDTYKSLIPSVEKLNYKLIVLDLPSIQEGASATKSASLADGVVLVVESERVRNEAILRVRDKFEDSGAKLLGIVLNKRRYYIPQWLYKRL